MTPQAIGKKIRQLRMRANISQRELSRRSGVNQGAISALERHGLMPSLAILGKLVEALGHELDISIQPKELAVESVRPLTASEQWLYDLHARRALSSDYNN